MHSCPVAFRKMLKFIVIVAAVAAGVLLLSDLRGCGGLLPQETVYDETKDESFLLAKEYASAGRYPEALDAFRRIIQEHPDASAESNLEAGLIAFRQGDFPLAIYHFNQYLWQRPDASSRARERVVGLINSSKKRFVQEMLPGRVAEPESSVPGLEEKYLSVTRENETLKREIERLRAELGKDAASARLSAPAESVPVAAAPVLAAQTSAAEAAPPPPPEKPPVPATHVVARGDTLSGISRKYYGTTARWRDIYEANRVTLSSPSALRPGMVLKLPRP